MQQVIAIPDHVVRIGFCADIHGVYDHVVRMRQRRPDVEHWFCAGDVVDKYKALHHNQPTLRIMARLGIPSVMGNHDHFVKQHFLHRLDPEARAYLDHLPFSLSVHFAGRRIRIYHATSRSREAYLARQAGERTFLSLFGEEEADVVVLGHTHEPYSQTFGGVHVINPGALGVTGVPASFCVLDRSGAVEFVVLEEGDRPSGA